MDWTPIITALVGAGTGGLIGFGAGWWIGRRNTIRGFEHQHGEVRLAAFVVSGPTELQEAILALLEAASINIATNNAIMALVANGEALKAIENRYQGGA